MKIHPCYCIMTTLIYLLPLNAEKVGSDENTRIRTNNPGLKIRKKLRLENIFIQTNNPNEIGTLHFHMNTLGIRGYK